ncbi:hypothetical protein [Streptomyces sp. NPDC000229]|uniref:hypothetical protein n=1 Tax=Streptomyces sp. NPDC000229 TaxID=3154247 RepID=UPI003332D7EC
MGNPDTSSGVELHDDAAHPGIGVQRSCSETVPRPDLEPISTEHARRWGTDGRLVPAQDDEQWTTRSSPAATLTGALNGSTAKALIADIRAFSPRARKGWTGDCCGPAAGLGSRAGQGRAANCTGCGVGRLNHVHVSTG